MKLNFEDKLTIYRLKSQGYDGLRRISTRSAPKNGYIASLCLPLSQDNKNILRLVVRKSPTGENTHYSFHSQDDKVEVSC